MNGFVSLFDPEPAPVVFGDWVSLGLQPTEEETFAAQQKTLQKKASTPSPWSLGYEPDTITQNLIALGREYSPADFNSMRREARAGDPRRYYAFLAEARRLILHPPIKRLCDGVVASVTTWSTPSEADNDVKVVTPTAVLARTVRDYEREQWAPWLPVLKREMAEAAYYGIAACRVETEVRGAADGRERISLVEPVGAWRFRVDPVTRRWITQANVYSGDWEFVDDLVERGELIFWEVDTKHPLDQRGFGWIAGIPWLIGQVVLRWHALKVEILAIPQRIGVYDPSIEGQKELIQQDLKKQAASPYVAIPLGSSLTTSQPPMGGATDPHQTLWEICKREIDLVILGHEQASGVRTGAGSVQSSEHAQKIVDARIDGLAGEVSTGPLQGAVRRSVRRNFGLAVVATSTPLVTSALKKPEDPKLLSEVAVNLKQAGAGGKVSVENLVRRCLGYVAKDGELTLDDLATEPAEAGDDLGAGRPAGKARQGFAARLGVAPADVDGHLDELDRLARSGRRAAVRAMEPLFAAIETATSEDDLEVIQRQLRRLADVIAGTTLEAAVTGAEQGRAAA